MQRALLRFIEGVRASKDAEGLRSLTEDALQLFGLQLFGYFSLAKMPDHHNIVVTTYPSAWLKRYTAERYDLIDPVILHCQASEEPFLWLSAPAKPSPRQRQLFEEAASYGIRCGFIIPFSGDHRELAGFAVVGHDPHAFRRTIARYRWPLECVASLVHVQAQLIFSDVAHGRLTPRERECLRWATVGKSAWEIGAILGISRRTVSFHLDNAKTKLKVRTLREAAIRLALRG